MNFKLTFNEAPDSPPPGMLPDGFEDKIMHCEFTVGQMTLFASDGCGEMTSISGFKLALSVSDKATAEYAFNWLAKGGEIEMPLGETFFSPCYGHLVDKFNVGWMVMVPGEQP